MALNSPIRDEQAGGRLGSKIHVLCSPEHHRRYGSTDRIKKRDRGIYMEKDLIQPGIHSSAESIIEHDFSKTEKAIVKYWSRDWLITSAGKRTTPGRSDFKFFLARPAPHIEEALNLSREIIVILSPYKSFEPRTLEAFDTIRKEFLDQRYESICYALISADLEVEQKLRTFLTNQENQIVVPFSYSSFEQNKSNSTFIRNSFQRFFYSRDLFDYSEPLKKDTFFFGRSDIVTTVIEKHKAGSNYGLFGLRKTGKTSIIFDVERKSIGHDYLTVFIDCQDTSFNMRRWNKSLYYVTECVRKALDGDYIDEADFTEENASRHFFESIERFSQQSGKSILLLFDEIENITYGKSSVDHWCTGLDFVYFWQSVRSAYQRLKGSFTFTIFGTNAKCIEEPSIQGKDNPIFNIFQPYYIPGFTHAQTREMVRRLGKIMGLKFDEEIYTHLIEDYGGHPFLVRRVCSKISQLNSLRPVIIDRIKYQEAKQAFNLENAYFEMILDVLKHFYPDEYEMLNLLAVEDYDNFHYFVTEDPSLVAHLIGYGLIKGKDSHFDFRIDAIKEYLVRKNGDHPVLKTPSEKWKHICSQRNELESDLRKMVKAVIKVVHKNEAEAKSYVVKKIYGNDPKYLRKSYQELFDSRLCNIYLKNLTDLINADWVYFSDYFGKQDVFIANMTVLNNEGRFDAHATVPEDEEINTIDNAAQYLRKCIMKYRESLE